MLIISLMPPDMLEKQLPSMVDAYVQDLVQSGAYASKEEAEKTAHEEMDGYFYKGKLLPNQVIYAIYLTSVDEPIGCVWVSKRSMQDPEKAFLCYITIDPEHRRKGYAKRALFMAEKKLLKLGIEKIGLNVFAHNPGAKELYLKNGYTITYEVSIKNTGKVTRYLLDKNLKAYYQYR